MFCDHRVAFSAVGSTLSSGGQERAMTIVYIVLGGSGGTSDQ